MCTHSGSEVLMGELFRSFLFQLVFYIYFFNWDLEQ